MTKPRAKTAKKKAPAVEVMLPPVDALPNDQQETNEDIDNPEIVSEGTAVLSSSDWTTQTILDQLDRGNIDLDPIFQRRDAWRPVRKSQFIESLILGLPVPQLVLAEKKTKRGAYIVIDGKQRLLSLRQFAAGEGSDFAPLFLQGLKLRPDLEGMNYEKLKEDAALDADRTAFENQTIRTVVIRNWPNENFLYTVFLRLNTGSVPLSPQELRQALHPGKFNALINDYTAESEALKTILRLKEPDFRMRDTELVIRYLAFRNFLSEYTGNLKPLLDLTADRFNREWVKSEVEVRRQLDELDSALSTAVEIFGLDAAFRKWNGTAYEAQINRAVFDVMVHYFSRPAVAKAALSKSDKVVQAFKETCADNVEFRASIEGTTKTIQAINMRFGVWASVLSKTIGLPVEPLKAGSR